MLSAFMMALLVQTHFQSPSCTVGEGWQFVIRPGEADRSPRWQQSNDVPPLTPGAAVRAGRSLLHRMSCQNAETWELAEVALRPVVGERDVWVYVVKFQEPLRVAKGSIGSVFPRVVEIPILLDGTALMPSVGPWPPNK
jgi:hypothetical protein